MSQANDLLTAALTGSNENVVEGHIVVGEDRYITVPEGMKKIGVQYDHNVETLSFDCPRYWDDHDMSKMKVYINYMRPDGEMGSHLCENVTVDSSDSTIMHFDWLISGHVTELNGNITFLVCIKNIVPNGTEENHWNSETNSDLSVSQGLKCHETILRFYPDIITQLLTRMESTETVNTEWKNATEADLTKWKNDIHAILDDHLTENTEWKNATDEDLARLKTDVYDALDKNKYTHPNSGVTAGTYRSVTVNAQGHVTGGSNPTVTIAQGGTGATTAKGAELAINGGISEVTSAVSDTAQIAMSYPTPDTSKGVFFFRKASLFWDYIKSKISSVLGLTETNYTGTSAKATADANGNNITSTYATKSELDSVEVPTKVSELENDKGYITSADIDSSQNHVHANKSVLDTITSERITAWNDTDLDSMTGTLPVAKGGTGATTAKGAEYNITSKMTESIAEITDTSQIAFTYTDASDTKGRFFWRKASYFWDYIKSKIRSNAKSVEYDILGAMPESTAALTDNAIAVFKKTSPNATEGVTVYKKMSLFWDYIKSKISSVLGLTESGLASGKSVGGIITRYWQLKDNGGKPVYMLMFDITTWYNSTTTNQSMSGFTGFIYSNRQGGYMNEAVEQLRMAVTYQKVTAEDGQRLCLRTSSNQYIPIILHDTINSKYYLALRLSGSGRNIYLQGKFTGTFLGTYILGADSSFGMPEGYEVAINDYKIITVPRATADANGNNISDTYLKKSGGTISNSESRALTVERTGSNSSANIQFKNSSGVLGAIGMNAVDGDIIRYKASTATGTETYTVLDTGNYKNTVTPANIGALKQTVTNMVDLGFTANSTVSVEEFLLALRTKANTNDAKIDFSWSSANGATVSDGEHSILIDSGVAYTNGSGNILTSTWATYTVVFFPRISSTFYVFNITANEKAKVYSTSMKVYKPSTSITPIKYGGTGASTAKEAEYNVLAGMAESTDVIGDTTRIVFNYVSPSATNGRLYWRNIGMLWDYIKGKADSIYLGISATASAASKWATARNINGMSIDGSANRINYGTCSTAAATAAKTVSCTGFALVTGAEITVKFTVTNTATSPTLNVNSTGAKAIYYRGSAITAGYLAANRTYTFRYNGTQWDLVGDINTDTNTDTNVKQTASTTANYRALLMGTSHNGDASALSTEETGQAYKSINIVACPSTGELKATKFTGALNGNAATATKATQDGEGNNIVDTYATKKDLASTENVMEINDRLDNLETVEISDGTLGEFELGYASESVATPIYSVFYDHITAEFIIEQDSVKFSKDGLTWTGSNTSFNVLYDMVYGDGKYITVGSNPMNYGFQCYTDARCTNFLSITVTSGAKGVCYAGAYGNGRFVVVGNQGAVFYSDDGITWSPGTSEITSDINTIIFANGYFLLGCKSAPYMSYSTDGVTWTSVNNAPAGSVNKLIYANGVYLALTNTAIMYNTDPISKSWITVKSGTTGQFRAGCYGNGRFVVVGDGGKIYMSSDGLNWTTVDSGHSVALHSIAYGNGKFVVGTATGVICGQFNSHNQTFSDAINSLYNKKLPYGLFTLQTDKWVSNSTYSGYTYAYEVPISDFYDAYPEYFLKTLSTTGLVPTEAEETAFELIGGMRLDVANMKLIFYASAKPSTSMLIVVKGVMV